MAFSKCQCGEHNLFHCGTTVCKNSEHFNHRQIVLNQRMTSQANPDSETEKELKQQRFEWATRIKNSRFFNDNGLPKEKTWGYDLYPERKKKLEMDLLKIAKMKEGREYYDKTRCEENVLDCVKKSPLVKIMMESLRLSGW